MSRPLPANRTLGRWNSKHDLTNSPHSAAADAEGNVLVVAWILGGRITKLIPHVEKSKG